MFHLNVLFAIGLMFILCLSPLLVCAANTGVGTLPVPDDFDMQWTETPLVPPANLEPGQVYTNTSITYKNDGVFEVTLYLKLLEYVNAAGTSIHPLEADTSVDFIYTIGSQFTFKEITSIDGGIFNNDGSGTITWSVPQNSITFEDQNTPLSISAIFTISLTEGWTVNTPYYTDETAIVTFTPAKANQYYYGMMQELVLNAYSVPRFNWNAGTKRFNSLQFIDNILEIQFTLYPEKDTIINGETYSWFAKGHDDSGVLVDWHDATQVPVRDENVPTNSWGLVTSSSVAGGTTYYFWIKPEAPSVFGIEDDFIDLVIYDIAVPRGGGNMRLELGDKTIYYSEPKKDTSFNWTDNGAGDTIEERLTNKGYIIIPAPPLYTITYMLNGGENAPNNPDEFAPEDLPLTIANPARANYEFLGWQVVYSNGTVLTDLQISYEIPVGTDRDVTLTAIWSTAASYNIYYELSGGDNDHRNVYSYTTGDLPITIYAPTRHDSEFLGWMIWHSGEYAFTDATEDPEYEIAEGITGDITFTAMWDDTGIPVGLKTYQIIYILNGGTLTGGPYDPSDPTAPCNPTSYNTDETPISIKDPDRAHYTFLGWTVVYPDRDANPPLEGQKDYTITEGTASDVLLVATWEPVSYTITYELDGGINAERNPSTYTVEDLPLTIETPSKAGYNFEKWIITYSNSVTEDLDPATISEIPEGTNGDILLTAHWSSPIEYTIKYETGAGTNAPDNPALYMVTESPKIFNATWTDYAFQYWLATFVNGTQVKLPTEVYGSDFVSYIPFGSSGDVVLEAVWLPDAFGPGTHFIIEYELGGGVNPLHNPTWYTTATGSVNGLPLRIENASMAGFVFMGWHAISSDYQFELPLTADGTAFEIPEYFDSGDGLKPVTGNLMLLALWFWPPTSYNIEYVLDGGVNAPANPSSYHIADLPLYIDAPYRVGYAFQYWQVLYSEADDFVTLPLAGIPEGTTGDLVLRAVWSEAIIYSITYELFGGNPLSNPASYTTDELPLQINDPTRFGYVFAGWVVAYANSTTYVDQIGYSIPVGSACNVTLAATWTAETWMIGDTFSITYHLNGGQQSMLGNPVSYSSLNLPLMINDPTRQGFNFLGWTVSYTNGTTVAGLQVGYEIPADTACNVAFTANWQSDGSGDHYAINYFLNGGVNAPSNPNQYAVETLPCPIYAPTRTDYNFIGWTVVYLIDGTSIYANDPAVYENLTYEIPSGSMGDINFIATWQATQYNITYIMQGGVNAVGNPTSYTVENSFPISIADPSMPDYTFLGWAVLYSNSTSETVPPALSYNIPAGTTGNIRLTALWISTDVASTLYYSVTYNGNGATGSVPVDGKSPYVHGSVVIVLDQNSLVKDGYTFMGWSSSSVANTVTHMPGTTFTLLEDTVLYAVWSKSSAYFSVTFDSAGGSSVASQTVLEGGKAVEPVAPTRLGYTFQGWFEQNAETVFDFDTEITDDITLTAHWLINTYTITYVYNSGSAGTNAPTSYTVLSLPVSISNPSRSGYTFAGWTVVFNGTGTPLTGQTGYSIPVGTVGNVVLTANWNASPDPSPSPGSSSKSPSTSSKPAATPAPSVSPTDEPVEPSVSPFEPAEGDVDSLQSWALVNLVLSVAGVILAIILFVCVLLQRKQKQEEQEQKNAQRSVKGKSAAERNEADEGEVKKQRQRRLFWFVTAVIMGVAGIVVFLLTEDMSLPRVMVDKWTIVNAVLFIVEIIAIALTFKRNKNNNDNNEDKVPDPNP